MSPFRQLATPKAGDDIIATATLEPTVDGTTDRSVQVWSIADQTPLAEFDTILDFGGRRLALCKAPDRMVVVAGAWERNGIRGYDARTGNRLWQRKDLTNVQSLSPAGEAAAAACFGMRSMQVLDVTNGATIATVRGVRHFWQSRHQAIGAAEVSGHVALLGSDDWKLRWRAPVAGFALLDAAFAPDAVLISDTVDSTSDANAAASVYCFDLQGKLLWERQLALETNVLRLGWDSGAGEWLGITHNVEQREPEMLLRWSREGDVLARHQLGFNGEYAFMPSGRLLVMGDGRMIDTKGAHQVGRLPTPRSEGAEAVAAGD